MPIGKPSPFGAILQKIYRFLFKKELGEFIKTIIKASVIAPRG